MRSGASPIRTARFILPGLGDNSSAPMQQAAHRTAKTVYSRINT
jgi:hypothetical protein